MMQAWTAVALLLMVVSPARSEERTTARTAATADAIVGAWQGQWVPADGAAPR
jgi:hypothetical protein